MHSDQLRERLNEIMLWHEKYNDGDHGYTYQIIKSCRFALFEAGQAMDSAFSEAVSEQSLNPILFAVARTYNRFVPDDEDDGYGRSTIGGVVNSLLKLQEEIGEEQLFSFDQLLDMRWNQDDQLIPPEPIDYRAIIEGRYVDVRRIASQYGCDTVELTWVYVGSTESLLPNPTSGANIKAVFFVVCNHDDPAKAEEQCRSSIANLFRLPVFVTSRRALAELPNRWHEIISKQYSDAKERIFLTDAIAEEMWMAISIAEGIIGCEYSDSLKRASLKNMISRLQEVRASYVERQYAKNDEDFGLITLDSILSQIRELDEEFDSEKTFRN